MTNIRLIACMDQNRGIGSNSGLLFPLKDDMERFKELTTGNAVVMGRKTYESLPNGVLKNRANFVISKTSGIIKGGHLYRSVEDFLIGGLKHPDVQGKIIYVIGGGEIYKQFLPHANYLDLTVVASSKPADTFFPEFNLDEWEKETVSDYISEKDVRYNYITCKRIIPL